jgi:Tfp pilus assembly protein PilF
MFTKILLKVELVAALVLPVMAYARLGENKKADESLKKALKITPDNAAANFNMGLMKAGQVQIKQFEEGITITMANDILFPEGG